jgi:hypothetical protein
MHDLETVAHKLAVFLRIAAADKRLARDDMQGLCSILAAQLRSKHTRRSPQMCRAEWVCMLAAPATTRAPQVRCPGSTSHLCLRLQGESVKSV